MLKEVVQLKSLAVQSAGTVTYSLPDMQGAERFTIYQRVSAASGTPTLNSKVQDSPDGTNWYDVASAATTEVSSANSQAVRVTSPVAKSVRVSSVVAGSDTPTVTFEIYAVIERPR